MRTAACAGWPGQEGARLAQLYTKAGRGKAGDQALEHGPAQRLQEMVRFRGAQLDDDLGNLAVVDGVAQVVASASLVEGSIDFDIDLESAQAATLDLGRTMTALEGDPREDQGGGHGRDRARSVR